MASSATGTGPRMSMLTRTTCPGQARLVGLHRACQQRRRRARVLVPGVPRATGVLGRGEPSVAEREVEGVGGVAGCHGGQSTLASRDRPGRRCRGRRGPGRRRGEHDRGLRVADHVPDPARRRLSRGAGQREQHHRPGAGLGLRRGRLPPRAAWPAPPAPGAAAGRGSRRADRRDPAARAAGLGVPRRRTGPHPRRGRASSSSSRGSPGGVPTADTSATTPARCSTPARF